MTRHIKAVSSYFISRRLGKMRDRQLQRGMCCLILFNPPGHLGCVWSPLGRSSHLYTCVSSPEVLAEEGASLWIGSRRNTVGGERELSTSTHLSLLLPDHKSSVTRHLMFSLSRLYPLYSHCKSSETPSFLKLLCSLSQGREK